MKVLFVVENYLPHIGGVEVVFRNLAEGLVKRGNTAIILTHRLLHAKTSETINGVQVKRVRSLHSRYIFSFAAIPFAIREALKADIIHTTTFNGALPAWIAAKLTGKKCVITVHEAWIGKWSEYTTMKPLQAAMHNFLERLIYMLPFDRYIAVSNSTRKQLIALGKNPEKVTTVYNAVDYRHFNPKKHSRKAMREELDLEDNFVVLTYGRPGPSKGIEYAIQAVPLIDVPKLKYIFILSKDSQYLLKLRSIRAMISRMGMQHRILLFDPVPHSQLPKYIRAADCVVVPSLSEGFGYTAAEACALGVPVIATNTTSLPEVVSGKYILVEPKSPEEIATAVERVYKKKYNTSQLKKFLLETNISNYLKVYREVLQSKRFK